MDDLQQKLPSILGEIEQVVGRKAALDIAEAYGGTRRKFPSPVAMAKNPVRYADNWLVKAVGIDAAMAIVKEILPNGGDVEIPTARSILRREYVRENQLHLTTVEMADVLGLTERNVRKIKASLRLEEQGK